MPDHTRGAHPAVPERRRPDSIEDSDTSRMPPKTANNRRHLCMPQAIRVLKLLCGDHSQHLTGIRNRSTAKYRGKCTIT